MTMVLKIVKLQPYLYESFKVIMFYSEFKKNKSFVLFFSPHHCVNDSKTELLKMFRSLSIFVSANETKFAK